MESQEQQQQQKVALKCKICYEEVKIEEVYTSVECRYVYSGHNTFCLGCVCRHVENKVMREDPANVTCPDLRCRAVMEPQKCHILAAKLDEDVIVRWETGVVAQIVRSLQLNSCPYHDCRAPLPDENAFTTVYVDEDSGGLRRVAHGECGECTREICYRCRVPWHVGVTCEKFRKKMEKEIDERNKMIDNTSGGGGVKYFDKKFKYLAKFNSWRRCPGCRIYVLKEFGCEHILCRCRYEFCYDCGKEWNWGHRCPLSYWRGKLLRFRAMFHGCICICGPPSINPNV